MNAPYSPTPDYLADTHEVNNVSRELVNYNMYLQDLALQEALHREGGTLAEQELIEFGSLTGSADYLELGHLANKYPPEFDTHDRFGHRVDLAKFHPAYHQLMKTAIEQGLHASPWTDNRAGAHVIRAAKNILQGQVEAGHGCPITMTFAAVPSIRLQPDLAKTWLPLITSRIYDPRNVPIDQKQGVTIGMGMTEKQGGSDVRANTTKAYAVGAEGGGQLYKIVGHKFFLSAPMCDAFLVLAQTQSGLSCFLVPRWQSNGQKNPLQVLRLKRKMGNVSNASSEVEFRGAEGWMVGEEGRGVRTIIEMVSMTRFDCMVGSSAGQRMAVSQALHHCSIRAAFGKRLIEQPLMQNVLADLILEYEGSLAFSMRMAYALDHRDDTHEDLLVRLGTAVGKYWICKRTPNHAYEAMECMGGSGVMEDSIFPRLYREAPINAIWEGSGNVQCLDVLRAMYKTPAVVHAFFAEIGKAQAKNALLDSFVSQLQQDLQQLADFEYRARDLVDRLALAFQAALLLRHAPDYVSHAFCASRLGQQGQHNYGCLPKNCDLEAIINRAWPQMV